MSIFNDIATAFETYPQDSCVVSIVDVALETGTQPAININEIWKFKIKVENNGHINMTDVSLHVTGSNDTTISTTGPTGSFDSGTQTFGALTVNGGGSQTSNYLYFKAPPNAKPAGTELVTAHIANWDGNWDHMFSNHTNHAPDPKATYSAKVSI